jgi:hypothetical protein
MTASLLSVSFAVGSFGDATFVSALIGIGASDTGFTAFFRADKIPNDGRHSGKQNQNNYDVFHNQGLQQKDLALSDY